MERSIRVEIGLGVVSSLVGLFVVASIQWAVAQEIGAPTAKTESFDREANWEGFNNRIVPKVYPQIVQDFGFSTTNLAGKSAGEMGGRVHRATESAFYGDKIEPKTLHDKLSASGAFAVTKSNGGSGIFFGWFNSRLNDGSGRPIGSLGMNMDGEGQGCRLAVRLITAQNQSCGTFITPFIPGKFRPTPIKNDGTRYAWKLDYDPAAAAGRGQFQFSIQTDARQPEEFEGKTFTVDLPEGYKDQGTTFDHFGLVTMTKAGGDLRIYFDDLTYAGRSQDFAQDPNWDALGNRRTYQAKEVGGAQDFGFSQTSFAGGKQGEIGGLMWRSPYGFYGDRVAALGLNDRLEARGRFVLTVGGPDSGMKFGWFNSQVPDIDDKDPHKGGNFVGIEVGGPTRVGHYFTPSCVTAKGQQSRPNVGPVIKQGRVYEWTLLYDPSANSGRGKIRATLGEESVELDLRDYVKKEGAQLDRFGICSIGTGGQQVKVYLDDLSYTRSPGK